MAETTMEPWSFTIVFDEDKAKKNGYEVDTLYDYVGKNVEGLGNERIARGTWRAAKGYDEVDAQTLAISKLSRQKWVMQNIKSLAFREDDDEIYDGIETIRRVYPERVFDSESRPSDGYIRSAFSIRNRASSRVNVVVGDYGAACSAPARI